MPATTTTPDTPVLVDPPAAPPLAGEPDAPPPAPGVTGDVPPSRSRARRRASGSSPDDTAPAKPPRDRSRERSRARVPLKPRLLEAIGGVGLMVSMVNPADGNAILAGAEQLAGALDNLARENPAVRRALEAALTGGAWSGVILAVAAIALPIAGNHGLIPQFGPLSMLPPRGPGEAAFVASTGLGAA